MGLLPSSNYYQAQTTNKLKLLPSSNYYQVQSKNWWSACSCLARNLISRFENASRCLGYSEPIATYRSQKYRSEIFKIIAVIKDCRELLWIAGIQIALSGGFIHFISHCTKRLTQCLFGTKKIGKTRNGNHVGEQISVTKPWNGGSCWR